MGKNIMTTALVFAICITFVTVSSADEKSPSQAKGFWQRLFNYPANVARESSDTVTDTAKRSTDVVAAEAEMVGKVASGQTEKATELVTEPVTATTEAAVKAVEDTAKIPVEAAKEETPGQ